MRVYVMTSKRKCVRMRARSHGKDVVRSLWCLSKSDFLALVYVLMLIFVFFFIFYLIPIWHIHRHFYSSLARSIPLCLHCRTTFNPMSLYRLSIYKYIQSVAVWVVLLYKGQKNIHHNPKAFCEWILAKRIASYTHKSLSYLCVHTHTPAICNRSSCFLKAYKWKKMRGISTTKRKSWRKKKTENYRGTEGERERGRER